AQELGTPVTLPTDAEVAACVAAVDLRATACSAPLALLEAGYVQVGMPFPSLPAPPPGGGEPPPPGPGVGAAQAAQGQVLAVYLDSVQERLRQAAVQAGDDPATVLPAAAAVQAAVASGDPWSAASAPALDALRQGYARYGLRFPEPGPAGAGSAVGAASAQAPAAAVTPTAAGSGAADAQLLESYLDLVLRKLERAAVDQGRDPADLKPAPEDVAAAVRSGRVDSAETTRVLMRLRAAYAELGLAFIEPGG
ncbi:hypothetical protein L6R53_31980, partial [Myxococcota bacterium]|nr:hypothetical protein [Myxococcota bacterium]